MIQSREREAIIAAANMFSLASVYAGLVLASTFFALTFIM